MATAGNGSSSLTLDSDEIEEMYCEHCENRLNKYAPAEGFCVECVEYLCDTCLGYHKWYMSSHSLQDKNSMPQDFCFDKCSVHTDQLIKFYCDDCQKIACCQCKTIDHASCTKVSHISKVAAGIENSQELIDLVQNMDSLSEKIVKIENDLNSRLQSVSAQETEALLSLSKYKEKIICAQKKIHQQKLDDFDRKMEEAIAKLKEQRRNLLQQSEFQQKTLKDKLNDEERKVIKKVQNVKNFNKTGLHSLKAKTMKIKADTDELSFKFKKQQKIGLRSQIFILMKSAKKYIENIDADVSQIDKKIDLHFETYRVGPELGVDNLNSDVTGHGKYFCFQHFVSSRRERNASYHSEISIKQVVDSSLCFLTETTLLISDYCGKCIIVLQDVQINPYSYYTVQMLSYPWGISKIEQNKVAVTFPQEKVLRLITFSETMNVASTKDIKVGAECRGIACRNYNLIVSYRNPAKVEILDISGNVLKTFDTHVDGQSVFEDPLFLAISPDKTIIYVSDYFKYTVTSMNFDGNIIAVYKDPQLIGPGQMTVDRSGTVFVCDKWSNTIHQLSSDLTKVKILLDKTQGMKHPMSVAYSSCNDILYVAFCGTNTIRAFNVSLS